MAIIRGYNKGLIVAIFSFIAIIIGLAAALKLSSQVAIWLKTSTNISSYWLPFLSFTIVMIAVVLLVRLGAKMIEKFFQIVLLGWINKLGGIILYSLLYTSILSVIFFYCNKMHLIKTETFASSKSYFLIEPFAPKVIDGIAIALPIFKDTFIHLTEFFEKQTHP